VGGAAVITAFGIWLGGAWLALWLSATHDLETA